MSHTERPARLPVVDGGCSPKDQPMLNTDKIKAGAAALHAAMEVRTRDNGDSFVAFREGSPEWMTDVAHAAHGAFMPDDWRYLTIRNLCGAIADAEDLEDDRAEIIDGEVEVYTSALTGWLHSSVNRLAYCDEAVSEMGTVGSMSDVLMRGQHTEIDEVYGLLIDALNEHAPEVAD